MNFFAARNTIRKGKVHVRGELSNHEESNREESNRDPFVRALRFGISFSFSVSCVSRAKINTFVSIFMRARIYTRARAHARRERGGRGGGRGELYTYTLIHNPIAPLGAFSYVTYTRNILQKLTGTPIAHSLCRSKQLGEVRRGPFFQRIIIQAREKVTNQLFPQRNFCNFLGRRMHTFNDSVSPRSIPLIPRNAIANETDLSK